MKSILFTAVILVISVHTVFSQTAHEMFMSSPIKMNTSDDPNYWVHGENTIQTTTTDDWNQWKFSYMGLEGTLQTSTSGDYTKWQVNGSDIVVEQNGSAYNNWMITGEDKSVSISTTNWNTWAITGDLVSGISTIVTDDFSEWEIKSGDWGELSPSYRASVVFISVISSSILKDYSM